MRNSSGGSGASIVRSSIVLIAVVAAALLALIPAAPGAGPVSASIIYIEVEPQGLGEVGYFPSPSGPASEWPRATTPIGSFFTMSFPQGTYMYLEARPYGCAELDRWEVTPEDVNDTPPSSGATATARSAVTRTAIRIHIHAFNPTPGSTPLDHAEDYEAVQVVPVARPDYIIYGQWASLRDYHPDGPC